MEKNKKMLMGVGIAVLVVIFVALGVNRSYDKKSDTPLDVVTPVEEVPVVVAIPKRAPSGEQEGASSKGLLSTSEKDYDKSLAEFGDKRIQFGQSCTATPTRSVYAEGEKIMIDNRSDQMRGVRIGSQNIVLQPYDFAIVSLFEKGEFGVNCGTLLNATTILVQ